MEFVKPQYKHSETTGKILAAAFEVHKVLGCGFSEFVYHRALEVEFRLKQIPFISEKEMIIFYKKRKSGEQKS
ncbi:MAG: GxxExxY protein [Flavitalea sp.]